MLKDILITEGPQKARTLKDIYVGQRNDSDIEDFVPSCALRFGEDDEIFIAAGQSVRLNFNCSTHQFELQFDESESREENVIGAAELVFECDSESDEYFALSE